MQIRIPDDFDADIRAFFAKCHVEPTDFQFSNFVTACLALGFDSIKESHDMMAHIVNNPDKISEPVKLPLGGVCPNCKKKIVIRQDLKRVCNCRVW